VQTRATHSAAAMPRVASSAETSHYIVDPPAPTDSTALTESTVRSKFLADAGPTTTIQTIALARFTDKLSLVRVDPVDPDAGRIDHWLAVVVVGNGPAIPIGGTPGPSAPPRNETVVAALDPVSGQLIVESWAPDETLSLAVATP
jgi:hypothetical protein